MYKAEMKRLLLMGLAGFIVGAILAITQFDEWRFAMAPLFAILFAGVPYGWILSGKVIGKWIVIGNIVVMIVAFMLRVFAAFLTGWFVYPIALIYTYIKMRKEKRAANTVDMEEV